MRTTTDCKQYGYQNVKQYVYHRDGYKCQNKDCKNTEKKPTLVAHHLRYRIKGATDRPDEFVTLCSQCHNSAAHKGFLKDWKPKTKGYKAETFMTSTYRMLIERLRALGYEVSYTYGYITKAVREELGIEKTHANDAFCIAGGTIQTRTEPLVYTQTRRNNRNLEKFYDAMYIDIRDGKKKYASELFSGRTTRNKNKNGENLRQYRGKKKRDGRRSIRKKRYPYQPNDLVKHDGKIYSVTGSHNLGTRVILKETGKSVQAKQLTPYRYSKGFTYIAV